MVNRAQSLTIQLIPTSVSSITISIIWMDNSLRSVTPLMALDTRSILMPVRMMPATTAKVINDLKLVRLYASCLTPLIPYI
ncbi:hypothetical protein TUM17567_36120 [Citrobacter amalonaticus]|nr:hypothetical protein TUM17567_36120 [Citrobacter amalonaticus]